MNQPGADLLMKTEFVLFMSLLRKTRKGQSCQKSVIDFQSISMGKKSKNDFSEGIHMELPVIRPGKYIKISFGISYLLCVLFMILSCTHRSCHQTEKEKITVHEYNENQATKNLLNDTIITEDSTVSFLNSLDVRLVLLNDSIFIGSPEKIDMKIINNSDYIVLTRNAYIIKHFEFGFWAALPEFEKLIWTDEGIVIEPKTERIFVAELDFLGLNLVQGRYRIEKEISILEKGKNSQIDNNNPIVGNRSLETEFVIK